MAWLWSLQELDILNINIRPLNLCIDIGNTRVKMAVLDIDNNIVDKKMTKNPSIRATRSLIKLHNLKGGIVSSTRNLDLVYLKKVRDLIPIIILDHHTSIPIKSVYETPETLGKDRLAGIIGAYGMFGKSASCVVDIGTCITFDVINKGIYLGGNISPGIHLRIKAMHAYTDKLPLVEHVINDNIVGTSTVKALQNGAFYGTKGEIESFIRQLKQQFGKINVIFTGGDAQLFAEHMESKIFVRPYLVLEGLNEIIKYNAA